MLKTRSAQDLFQDPILICFFISCLAGQFTLFHIIRRMFPVHFPSEKSQAWILTLASSGIMTLGSMPLVYAFMRNGFSIDSPEFMLNGAYVDLLSAYFISYLWSDLFLGSLHYMSQVNLLSGWFHHIMYTFIVSFAMSQQVAGIFCLYGVLELPTFLLSLGMVRKSLRHDILFGISFFLTRIVLHVILIFSVYDAFPSKSYYAIALGVFPLHVLWFHGWIRQQLRLYQLEQRKKDKAETIASSVYENAPKSYPLKKKFSNAISSSKQDIVASIKKSPKILINRIKGLTLRAGHDQNETENYPHTNNISAASACAS
jgi:hypothetical protein